VTAVSVPLAALTVTGWPGSTSAAASAGASASFNGSGGFVVVLAVLLVTPG
jgi:hypothetical protein